MTDDKENPVTDNYADALAEHKAYLHQVFNEWEMKRATAVATFEAKWPNPSCRYCGRPFEPDGPHRCVEDDYAESEARGSLEVDGWVFADNGSFFRVRRPPLSAFAAEEDLPF